MRKNIYWAVILVFGAVSQVFAEPAVTIGWEERFRYEYKKDFDLNADAKDNGGLFFHRFRLNAKATLGDGGRYSSKAWTRRPEATESRPRPIRRMILTCTRRTLIS